MTEHELFVRNEAGEYVAAPAAAIVRAVAALKLKKGDIITNARDATSFIQARIGQKKIEHVMAIFTDNANRVVGVETISTGVEDQAPAYPKDIARRALLKHATGVILAHNHPTGHLTPSGADHQLTKGVGAALATLDIRFLDHVIVGAGNADYFSFREHGFMN